MAKKEIEHKKWPHWRHWLHDVIYEADTRAGKAFDVVLLILILLSVLAVMLETVESLDLKYHKTFFTTEWIITGLFTIEYLARIFTVRKPRHYILSFFGIVDLLSILPTYIGLFIPGAHSIMMIRALRLVRVFRIFKLARYTRAGKHIALALKHSRPKIIVFLISVLTIVSIIGSAMYLIEGRTNGFTSIPQSIYWAIVTLTTVGYGDISPVTPLGKFLAVIVMLLGYGMIAVPTGLVTAELVSKNKDDDHHNTQACLSCGREGHADDAEYCKYCGELINEE